MFQAKVTGLADTWHALMLLSDKIMVFPAFSVKNRHDSGSKYV